MINTLMFVGLCIVGFVIGVLWTYGIIKFFERYITFEDAPKGKKK